MKKAKLEKWFDLTDKKPEKFRLVLFKDSQGKNQPGWWDGTNYCFGNQRIATPVFFCNDPGRFEPSCRELESVPKIYSFPGSRDGIKHVKQRYG